MSEQQKPRWTYKFEPDNDLGDWNLTMVRKRENEIVRTPKSPSLLLEQHEKTIRKILLRGILYGELAPYAHGVFFVITAPRVNGVNKKTGVISEMEFRTKPQTVVIENEADFHWFIETVANDFATREANYIKEGILGISLKC